MSNIPRSMNDIDPLPVLGPRPVPTVDMLLPMDYWLQLPGGFSINRQGQRAYTPNEVPPDAAGADRRMINRDEAGSKAGVGFTITIDAAALQSAIDTAIRHALKCQLGLKC